MKKLLTILLLAFGAALNLGGQNYVVDIMFGKDSVALTPLVQESKSSKSRKAEQPADPIYIKDGETVQLVSVGKDSLKLVDLLRERVTVRYAGKQYTMSAANLKFSDDNPEGATDTLKARLVNHKGIDIHGAHRWLFNIWLVWILLGLGLLSTVMLNVSGTRWALPQVLALALLWAYVLVVGFAASAWIISTELATLPHAIIDSVLILSWFALLLRFFIRYLREMDAPKILLVIPAAIALPLLGFAYLSLFWVFTELSMRYWWVIAIIIALFFVPDAGKKIKDMTWEEWHESYYGDKAQAERKEKERQFRKEQKDIHGV